MRHAVPAEEVAVEGGRGVVDGVPANINVISNARQCNAFYAINAMQMTMQCNEMRYLQMQMAIEIHAKYHTLYCISALGLLQYTEQKHVHILIIFLKISLNHLI